MIKEIRKLVTLVKSSAFILGLWLVGSLAIKAEAVFFLPSQAPYNLLPTDMKNVDKKTYSPIIIDKQPVLFLNQTQPATPVNLRHNPQEPNAFLARGIPQSPTVQQLLNNILKGTPDGGYRVYIEQWVVRRGETARLTDQKLTWIWREAQRINLDPFYFLAILAKEGTGSFNTLPSSGGGQPHPNFEEDVKGAAGLIKREIDEWRQNGCPGDWLRWVNYGNGGNTYTDGYAQDVGDPNDNPPRPPWWEVVRDIYNGPRLKVK